MRCMCPICAELYEQSSEISALTCGHTFHYDCVKQWIARSKTCPTCRKKVLQKDIIHPLYFDQGETEGEDRDEEYAKIKNDLDTAQAAIRQRELEKAELVMDKKLSEKAIDELKSLKQVLEVELREEKTANTGLKRELRSYRTLISEAEEAKKDAAEVRKQLKDLTNIKKIVGENEAEIDDLLSQYQGDSRSIAVWCVLLRKELAGKKRQCRKLQETCDKTRKESEQRRSALQQIVNENKLLKDQKKNLEEDLENVEHENRRLKEKIETLGRGGDDLEDSFIQRCLHESPAPLQPKKRPRLSLPEGDFDLDDISSPSSSLSSSFVSKSADSSPSFQHKNTCKEYGTQYVKISNIASAVAKKPKQKPNVLSDIPMALNGYNLFKKPGTTGFSSVIKKGYDGMGSHETFIKPSGRPCIIPTKKSSKSKNSIFKPKATTSGVPPPLPSLNHFM